MFEMQPEKGETYNPDIINDRIDFVSFGDQHLHNIGAPSSRIAKAEIKATFAGIRYENENKFILVNLPDQVNDVMEWLNEVAQAAGFKSFDQVKPDLPSGPSLVLLSNDQDDLRKTANHTPAEIIRSAAILARCANRLYNPEHIPVFSVRRMNRIIRLIELPAKDFYELD